MKTKKQLQSPIDRHAETQNNHRETHQMQRDKQTSAARCKSSKEKRQTMQPRHSELFVSLTGRGVLPLCTGAGGGGAEGGL